ncbi:MAG TPA: hypothetical protein P5560_02575 [Thermotogota bacterium]|nr:hypothetical protein [Thermotogota bacterium]HRW91815.1 hypothetical protein [Thermotogota bacterium]
MKHPFFKRQWVWLATIVLLLLVFLSGCLYVPQESFELTSFVDMRLNGFSMDSFRFSTLGQALNKEEEYLGTVFQASFFVDSGEVLTFVASQGEKRSAIQSLWFQYRKSDEAGLGSLFRYVPYYYGEYEASQEMVFTRSWFFRDWFFRISGETEEAVQEFYGKVQVFMERNFVVNRSVEQI